MNILFLAPDVNLRRERGDAVHVRELCAQLATLGHAIVLFAGGGPDDTVHGVRRVMPSNTTLSQIVQATKLARGWADIIYERRFSPKLSWAVSSLTGLPYILEVNGVLEEETPEGGLAGGFGEAVKALIRGAMVRRAARIVAVSRGVRAYLITKYHLTPKQVIVVPNGANTTLFSPKEKESCRKELGLAQNGPVICYVGNMTSWQGVDDLLRAIAEVRQRITRIIVLLVGDGPDLVRLRSLASSLGITQHVRFEGTVPYERAPVFIGASDVCVAPFKRARKASPIKVFEYLACARPVVACDIDEVGDLLRNTGGGLAIPAGDDTAIASAIVWLMEHPAQASEMGIRGRRAIEAEKSWLATARKVERILEAARAN